MNTKTYIITIALFLLAVIFVLINKFYTFIPTTPSGLTTFGILLSAGVIITNIIYYYGPEPKNVRPVWITEKGERLTPKEMSTAHLKNCITFILSCSTGLYSDSKDGIKDAEWIEILEKELMSRNVHTKLTASFQEDNKRWL